MTENISPSRIIESIFPKEFNIGPYLVSKPLNNKRALENFFDKNPQSDIVVKKAFETIENLPDEPKIFSDQKVCIDFVNGKITLLPYKLFFDTKNDTNIFIPTGISIALVSSEKDIICIQRSKDNDLCPGYLGTPAAYMSFPQNYQSSEIDINKLWKYNAEKTVSRELGIELDDQADMAIYGVINAKIPLDQQEILVLIESNLPTRLIILYADKNSSNKEILVPEPKVIAANSNQLDRIFKDKKIPMSDQHGAALLLASFVSKFGSGELRNKRYTDISKWINTGNSSIN